MRELTALARSSNVTARPIRVDQVTNVTTPDRL